MPWVGSFAETHLRLYTVDHHGMRGTVFLVLNADRLAAAAVARGLLGVPYTWSPTRITRHEDTILYETSRRWPRGPGGLSFAVEVNGPCTAPTALEQFVTARWSMHSTWLGKSVRIDVEHPPWPLFRAGLERLDVDPRFFEEVGLPVPGGPPTSVLWSPGVESKVSAPVRL